MDPEPWLARPDMSSRSARSRPRAASDVLDRKTAIRGEVSLSRGVVTASHEVMIAICEVVTASREMVTASREVVTASR
ncbi:unnamed protein product [Arabis nemorensis]|uniref:Uncharacterized protein n=1 Tax=Arabis nemorensis TaxID=586526 RepID=A0A565CPY3_9BRAS|nr:unnamed protein product [Arabis nemorensis]